MSIANTLGPDGDSLYNDKANFTNLESTASPLPDIEEVELRNLLHLVRTIISQSTVSMSESKAEAKIQKTTRRTDSGNRVSGAMHRYASGIGQQIAPQDGKNDSEKTWRILKTDPEFPLKTKAILSLVAFATMYGKVRLAALVDSNQLAKSITLLKQQPNVRGENELKKWFEALSRVIELTLDVADGVMNLKESQPFSSKENLSRKPMLLPTAVYRIINIVVICWSQVVNILIKRSGKDILTNLWTLSIWERALNDKRREIEEELAKYHTQQEPIVPNEQSKAGSLPEGQASLSCWWKLCRLLNPTTVKSKRQTMLLYTATHSLPDRRTVSSTTEDALPMDKEAAERSSSD